jgi:hypothetical protein
MAITQEALDQAPSVAERKTENGSHVSGRRMDDEQLSAADGSSEDSLLFSATDDRELPIHWDGNGVSTDHTLLDDANGPTMITQESSGEATISTSSNLAMTGKSSPAPTGSEGMGMHEGDPFQHEGKNSSVQTRAEDMAMADDDTMQVRILDQENLESQGHRN